MDKQDVATEIRARWTDMPESDITKVIDAIWQHALRYQIELNRCYTTSNSVNVTGQAASTGDWPKDDQVIAYIHAGHVDLFYGPRPKSHRIELTNYRGGYTQKPRSPRVVRHRR